MRNQLHDAVEPSVRAVPRGLTQDFGRAGPGSKRSGQTGDAENRDRGRHAESGRAEQRQFPRHSMTDIRGGTMSRLSNGTPVRVRDVSLGGLQLQLPSRHQITAGATIAIGVRSRRGVVHVVGVVAWVSQQRCGIRLDWDKTPAFAKTYLGSLIDGVID